MTHPLEAALSHPGSRWLSLHGGVSETGRPLPAGEGLPEPGGSPAWKVKTPRGDWFVKRGSADDEPWRISGEVEAREAVRRLGVPGVRPAHRVVVGGVEHLATPWLEGSFPLDAGAWADSDPAKRAGLASALGGLGRAGLTHLAAAEWLVGEGDRHTNNYVVHGGELVPVDYGHAWLPPELPSWLDREGDRRWHSGVERSALLHPELGVHRHAGGHLGLHEPLPQGLTHRLLGHVPMLRERLGRVAARMGPRDRALAIENFTARAEHLKRLATMPGAKVIDLEGYRDPHWLDWWHGATAATPRPG